MGAQATGFGNWVLHKAGSMRLYVCALGLVLASLAGLAGAVEFGEASVKSYIGQPLNAEVELLGLTPEESSALQVRAAGLDVYRGANIQYNPVLKSLHFVVRHRDRRQFIRLISDKPVSASYLNLFFEMGTKGDYVVRALTLWLEPNPNQATEPESAAQAPSPALLPSLSPSSPLSPSSNTDAALAGRNAQSSVASEMAASQTRAAHGAENKGFDAASVPPHAGNCAQIAGRCRATEQVNRIIAARITELEKEIMILNQEILRPSGKAGSPVKSSQASQAAQAAQAAQAESGPPVAEVLPPEAPMPEASSGNGLFLEKEPVLLPKKVPPKPVWWRQYGLWLAGGALLLVSGALLAWRVRASKRAKAGKAGKAATDDEQAVDPPEGKAAGKGAGSAFKFDRARLKEGWQNLRAKLFAPFTRLKEGMTTRLQALRSRFGKKKPDEEDEPALEDAAKE